MHFFHWTDETIEKLAQHDVTPAEFEAAFEAGEDIENRGRHDARIGYDSRGRLLFCVHQNLNGTDIVPITAFEIEQ